MKKYYKIADLNVLMESSGRTERQAEKYICAPFEQADIIINPDPKKVRARYSDMELTEDDCIYLSTGFRFRVGLVDFGGFVLHSSAVVVDGRAYLFTADSGTGKSTHTNLWLERFGERAYILNDDKPALRLIDGIWYAYGTPWSGKHDISVNTGVPLAGIAALERGDRNEIMRIGGIPAIQAIFKQLVRPTGAAYRMKLLDHIDKLISSVAIWKLKCNMEPEAAIVSYEAMSGLQYEKGE